MVRSHPLFKTKKKKEEVEGRMHAVGNNILAFENPQQERGRGRGVRRSMVSVGCWLVLEPGLWLTCCFSYRSWMLLERCCVLSNMSREGGIICAEAKMLKF